MGTNPGVRVRDVCGFCSLVSSRTRGGRSATQSHGFLPALPVSSPAKEDSNRGQGALQGFRGTRRHMLGSGLQGWTLPRHLRWGHVCHVLEVRRRTGRVGHACRRVSRDQLSREASCSGTPTSACFLPTGHGTPVPLRDRHLENVGSGHRSGCGGVDPGPQESRATCTGAFPSHVGSCALARPGFGGPARCWTVLLLGAACR